MLTSQFTQEQNALVKSYMPAFEAMTLEVDPNLENKNTTKYRQEKTTEIMTSELFNAEVDKGNLRKRIMKKFSNYYQEMKRKRGVCGTRGNNAEVKPIKLFEETTGRQLFEHGNKSAINEQATQRRLTTGSGNHAGHYQAVLREMWEGLDDSERDKYNQYAQEQRGDIYANQREFMSVIWKQLKNMCQNGKLGPAEMMLLFAFRDQEGDISSGVVSAHSAQNSLDMRNHINDFKERFETPWNEYVEQVLPTNITEEHNQPHQDDGISIEPRQDDIVEPSEEPGSQPDASSAMGGRSSSTAGEGGDETTIEPLQDNVAEPSGCQPDASSSGLPAPGKGDSGSSIEPHQDSTVPTPDDLGTSSMGRSGKSTRTKPVTTKGQGRPNNDQSPPKKKLRPRRETTSTTDSSKGTRDRKRKASTAAGQQRRKKRQPGYYYVDEDGNTVE